MDMKKFYKKVKATWEEATTKTTMLGWEWLNEIAFHNYYKYWNDCYRSEKVYVLGTFYNWIKTGKLKEVK